MIQTFYKTLRDESLRAMRYDLSQGKVLYTNIQMPVELILKYPNQIREFDDFADTNHV